MSEPLFRAWDKIHGKWIHPSLMVITNAGFYPDHRAYEDGLSLFNYEYDLMQDTGLKDKHNTRIYVGDILKWNEKEWGGPFNELVEWDFEQLSSRANDWHNHCEIIGNKWDNPELVQS